MLTTRVLPPEDWGLLAGTEAEPVLPHLDPAQAQALVVEVDGAVGYGVNGKPDFWIGQAESAANATHVAFKAGSREQVRKFYDAAIAAGGDNGPPGIREMYHPNYYGAFVLDPDGYNIEAVCHDPE